MQELHLEPDFEMSGVICVGVIPKGRGDAFAVGGPYYTSDVVCMSFIGALSCISLPTKLRKDVKFSSSNTSFQVEGRMITC